MILRKVTFISGFLFFVKKYYRQTFEEQVVGIPVGDLSAGCVFLSMGFLTNPRVKNSLLPVYFLRAYRLAWRK